MTNKQVAFIKSGLTLILCFLLAGAGIPRVANAANPEVAIQQQTRRVTGSVKDVKGEPLLGVNVIVRGTTNGTVTDFDGNYSLEIGTNDVLVFSYIGYISQTLPVSGNVLNVVLNEDTQNLSEVVVVGYGTQQKKDITGSVAVVDTKDLLKASGSSASQQLQGKAAGVYIGSSGAPGSQTMVRIRGINTINDNGPLYVIDGVSSRNSDLSSINPNDIESLQVLKDASAAAIYGAQAANGVILITTKKGLKTGQPVITYDGYFGLQKSGKRYDTLSSEERLKWEWDAQMNYINLMGTNARPSHQQFGDGGDHFIIPNYMTTGGAGGSQTINPADYGTNNVMVPFSYDVDWWDEIDRIAPMQSHQVSLQGGNDKGQYNMSVGYFDQQGTVIETYYTRYTARANSSYNIRPWLRFGENFSYTWTKDLGRSPNTGEASSYSWAGYRSSPWVPVYDIQGNYAGSVIAGTGNWQNAVADIERQRDNYWSNSRIFGNIWAEVDLYKGLTYRNSFGLDYTNNYSYRMGKQTPEFSEGGGGQSNLTEESGFNFRWVWSNTLSYTQTFNEVHRITALVGTEAIRDGIGRSMLGQRYNYLYPENVNTWVLDMGENNDQRRAESSYKGEFALFGIFGRVDYAFADKYLFTGILRRDGVSRFSTNNRYGTFPSVSLGWRLSEEAFLEGTREWLDDLKARIGYGQTGNSEIPRKNNFAYEYTTDPTRTNYDLGGANSSGSTGYRLQRYGNEDTKWESVDSYSIGLDGTFLNGKFGLGVEWYSKKTSDMLLPATYSGLAGEPDKPYVNFGDMKNTGIEATLNYRDSQGELSWDVSLNLSHYKNEVVRLSEADDYAIYGSGTRLDAGPVTRTTKGRPISEFYGYKVAGFYESVQDVLACQPLGQNLNAGDAQAWVGRFKFQDTDGNGSLTADDRISLGSPHPDLIAGLNAGLTYKGFDFTMFWYSTIGNELFNNVKAFTDFNLFRGQRSPASLYQSWKPGADNSNAILPLLNAQDGYSGSVPSSYYVEDASYLALKNLVIGYTLPRELLRKATIQSLRLYVQAENTLILTKYTGLTPEVTNAEIDRDVNTSNVSNDLRKGIDMGGYPTVMRFIVGLNFTF
ncbi:MAG: TonB-dependent receptor [Tannerellaceae bacterium]|jgi:TonB-linked SusC/RagA family outer membrane protein|nr:TonB-dependent receptor [Tannerellaceae bacterium]